MVTPLLPVHIFAGIVGLLSGTVALYAVKGATVHRRSGDVFVFAMLAMSLAGATIAGLLTAYLVLTGYTSTQPVTRSVRRLGAASMVAALSLSVTSVALALDAI